MDAGRPKEKIEGEKMKEIRCKKCRRLLMKVVNDFAACGIYIKCPKCHYYQHFGSVLETEEEKNLAEKTQEGHDHLAV
jgi:phage FluMu protein Com